LRLDAGIDGLDALEALPPLVRPGLISDLEGYDAWETASLAVLAQPGLTSRQALDAIAAATEDVREWKPGAESLSARVVLAFGRTKMPSPSVDVRASFIDVAAHCFPVPAGPVDRFDDVWARMVAPRIGAFEPAIRNYLAARLFGNWIAYQGRGWRTIVAWLRTSLGVLENELARGCGASGQPLTADDVIAAFAAADRLLVHTVDSDLLGRHFAPAEGPEPR
jgi:hypothetical protein